MQRLRGLGFAVLFLLTSSSSFGQNRVFVTDGTVAGDFGGLAGGDDICQSEAGAATLGGGPWVAWLSTVNPQTNAVDRLVPGSFELLDGTPVANSIADLTDGTILSPINLTPTLNVVMADLVWTGTDPAGEPAGPPNDCTGWTAGPFGWYGDTSLSDDGWTFVGTLPCDNGLRLYCFETAQVMSFCGDGTVDPGEECDDGNNTDGDGCSANCTIEPFCGDGNLDPGEGCDDGNNTDGDGCSANCTVEVPTLGQWGALILALVLLVLGVLGAQASNLRRSV